MRPVCGIASSTSLLPDENDYLPTCTVSFAQGGRGRSSLPVRPESLASSLSSVVMNASHVLVLIS